MRLEGQTIDSSIRLERFLGEGASAEVYSGITLKEISGLAPNDHVAVKVYKPHILEYPNERTRIEQEFRAGSSLRHPNLLSIYSKGLWLFNSVVRPYLVMELLDGKTLRQFIAVHHPIAEHQIISFSDHEVIRHADSSWNALYFVKTLALRLTATKI
ncbi:MAG: protein kinase [Ignavibacteriae bacterium]|nr:protein kinase [Ignavibacteriota bacterium]